MPPSDRWPDHVSRADSAADCWLCRPLAHRTVRCTPDSPVNFSRSRRRKPESGWFAPRWSGAPDTVRCTPDSPVSQPEAAFGCRSDGHTSELQSPCDLVCRLLLEMKTNEMENLNCCY